MTWRAQIVCPYILGVAEDGAEERGGRRRRRHNRRGRRRRGRRRCRHRCRRRGAAAGAGDTVEGGTLLPYCLLVVYQCTRTR